MHLNEYARPPEPKRGSANPATGTAEPRPLRGQVRSAYLVLLPALIAIAISAADAPMQSGAVITTPDATIVQTQAPAAQRVTHETSSRIDTAPPRASVGLQVLRNGWNYNCMECHTLIGATWRYNRPLNEHQTVTLEHGTNRFCLNCHHATNRNAYADYDGTEISDGEVVQLCAKCHGTIFRDWQAGVHGRQNGYWDARAGEKHSLRCIECHDPHQPKFTAMKPLPPLRYPARAANPPVHHPAIHTGPP